MGVTRHTKIIATLGPASSAPSTVDALLAAGVDVFRLNFSHGSHESHQETFRRVRDAAARAKRQVAILQDLSGPKIRLGRLHDGKPISVKPGDTLRLAAGDDVGTPTRLFTPNAELIRAVQPGDRLLIDDGRIELRVTSRTDDVAAVVVHGGVIEEHKGITAPGIRLAAAALTSKDEEDLRFGFRLGVDLVALSYVQSVDDVHRARAAAQSLGWNVPFIAKIERPQALEDLDGIVAASDGVMVARGDLGLECPLEQVPRIQKEIVRSARARGRPVIVATQVLESMRTEPRPTRAEVSDAATAVDQSVDAIMLAGETSVGDNPVRAVETLAAIIREAEGMPLLDRFLPASGDDREGRPRHARALCEAAVTLATTGQAEAIVAVTRQGKTARLLSSLRPAAAIVAVTSDEAVANRLALYWGVRPLLAPADDPSLLERWLPRVAAVSADASIVFINVSPDLRRRDANYLNLQRLG